MKYLLRIILLTAAMSLLINQADVIGLEAQTITAEDIYDSFIYEDYVVEGVILSVKSKKILHEEFNPYVDHPGLLGKKIRILEIEFKILNELIGNVGKKSVTLIGNGGCLSAGGKTRNLVGLERGDTIIIPLRNINKGIYESGKKLFITGWDSSRFVIKGNTFLRGRKNYPLQKGNAQELYRAIEKVRKKRSIKFITEQAKLIVRGTIKDKWTIKDTLSTGFSKNIVRMKIEIDDCFKGDIDRDEVEFSVIYRPNYEPFWQAKVSHVNIGEDWLVFLKWAEEPGYYPFAGLNGMFKIEEGHLIRDNRITMKKDLEEAKSIIMKTLAGSDKDE